MNLVTSYDYACIDKRIIQCDNCDNATRTHVKQFPLSCLMKGTT